MIKAKCDNCGIDNIVYFDGDIPYIWCFCGKKVRSWQLIGYCDDFI